MTKVVTKNEVAKAAKNEVAAVPSWYEEAEAMAGAGTSQDADDNIVPIVRRLQALSPQLNDGLPEYIEGAKTGDVYLKDDDPQIIKGDQGFYFQPCAFYKDVVEWKPRESGGGLVARHPEMPADAEDDVDPKNGRPIKTRNGNLLVDTRYHAGFLILPDGTAKPYAIPMKSTDHTISRMWMNQMNAKKLKSGNVMPSFMNIYKLRTKNKTNAAGTWKTWEITFVRQIEADEEWNRGKALYDAFNAGERAIEIDDAETMHEDREDTTM